jgi:adenine/guanine phosphoribosyltransferase-like PRPP-binding protein
MEVVETLSEMMADSSRAFEVDVVVGLPTLGLAFAPLVAKSLGFTRYIPFGYSRKYWYREDLAVPVQSLTTPDLMEFNSRMRNLLINEICAPFIGLSNLN